MNIVRLLFFASFCVLVQSGPTIANGPASFTLLELFSFPILMALCLGELIAQELLKRSNWAVCFIVSTYSVGFAVFAVTCMVVFEEEIRAKILDSSSATDQTAEDQTAEDQTAEDQTNLGSESEMQKTIFRELLKLLKSFRFKFLFTKLSNSETRNEKKKKKKKNACEIIVRELPVNHPLFIEFSTVIIPKIGVIRFAINEQFEVNCVQSTFSNGFSSKSIQCVGNNKYKIIGQSGSVDVSAFNKCIKKIQLTSVDGELCPEGVMKRMVFVAPTVEKFELYSSCYNMKTSSTIYGRYLIYGQAFDGGSIDRLATSFKEIHKGFNIDAMYIKSGYQRGHLMPFADGIFPAWRQETNNLINTKPQIGTLNGGAWRSLELSIRKEAIARKQTLEVYTGAFDFIRYLNEDLKQVEIHKFWYKIVKGINVFMNMNGNTGIVFVACNDERLSCITELASVCRNICTETHWLSNAVQNKITCCSLKDFYANTKVSNISGTEGITKDMISIQSLAPGA